MIDLNLSDIAHRSAASHNMLKVSTLCPLAFQDEAEVALNQVDQRVFLRLNGELITDQYLFMFLTPQRDEFHAAMYQFIHQFEA